MNSMTRFHASFHASRMEYGLYNRALNAEHYLITLAALSEISDKQSVRPL